MDMEEIVCPCLDLSAQDIKDAIDNGADSFDSVVEKTEATTVCGICEDRIQEIVSEFLG